MYCGLYASCSGLRSLTAGCAWQHGVVVALGVDDVGPVWRVFVVPCQQEALKLDPTLRSRQLEGASATFDAASAAFVCTSAPCCMIQPRLDLGPFSVHLKCVAPAADYLATQVVVSLSQSTSQQKPFSALRHALLLLSVIKEDCPVRDASQLTTGVDAKHRGMRCF